MIIMILIGIFTGILTGLTSASGVVIVVPLTNMLLHFTVHHAIGTSLMVDVIAPFFVAFTYYRYGNIDFGSGLWIGLGTVVGAQTGSYFSSLIPDTGLGLFFATTLFLSGILIFKGGINVEKRIKIASERGKTKVKDIIYAILLGYVIGIITGLLGAGGGIMIFLVLVFVLKYDIRKALGTSALIMVITSLSGAIGYAIRGYVDFKAGLTIGVIAAITGSFAAVIANKVKEKTLKNIVGGTYILLSILMVLVKYLYV